jgi:hypothetical protein
MSKTALLDATKDFDVETGPSACSTAASRAGPRAGFSSHGKMVTRGQRHMHLRGFLILSLAVAAACGSPTAPRPELATFVSMAANSAGAPPDATNPPTVRASRGRIDVVGLVETPTPCQTLSGDVMRSGQTLSLNVAVRSTGGACVLILGRFAYTAGITGLAAGVYKLDVTYLYPGTGWPTSVVFSQSVTVD